MTTETITPAPIETTVAQIMGQDPGYAPIPIAANILAGLPEDFTLESLQATFSPDEIARMRQGDDPILPPLEAPVAEPVPAPEPVPVVEAVPVPVEAPVEVPTFSFATTTVLPVPAKPDLSQHVATIATLDTQIAALRTKLSDGEMTEAEVLDQQTALVTQRTTLDVQARLAQQAYDAGMTQVRAAWVPLVTAFQQANPHLTAPEHFSGWDASLKAVNENPTLRSMSMERRIELAAQNYAASHKSATGKDLVAAAAPAPAAVPVPPAAADPAPTQAPPPVTPGPRTDQRPDPVQTLAGFTAADTNSTDGTRFGHIHAMAARGDSLAAEAAIAALPPHELEALLAGE